MIPSNTKSLFLLLWIVTTNLYADKKIKELVVKEAKIQFISEAPQETIRGNVTKVFGSANLETKKVSIQIDLKALNIPSRMMNRHMHENYLETELYPNTNFVGVIKRWDIKSKIVEIEGDLTLHGVTKKKFKIQGNIEETEKDFLIRSNFEIHLADFKIEVPKLVILKLNDTIQIESEILWKDQE
ncbi:YceI family protein [Leptospira bourretii]|uniref:YceI family protein n=1 Tax=Leptospira bourretii TaxID=2484962 RepID=A0A4R9IIL1_9LEPT|nr:YceI family protein [Leptospira bourretii]TGK88279.1 YceI family protein [Leptospira bourretii]TGK88929.1 YceI family protein [Leptospira bourretii]TGL21218.1 YceI family protein [Leptospira bourretii]TGL26365.1 YceI family protein [Leptospira bourretii]